jgi:hypothetical protein
MTDDQLTAAAADVFKHFDYREAESARSAQIKAWAVSIFCWDGILPLTVAMVPKLIAKLFQGAPRSLEVTFVAVPIAALLLRYVNGRKKFRTGQMFRWQAVAFGIAVLLLFVFDAMLVMISLIPNQAVPRPVPRDAYLTCVGVYLIYLPFIAMALFPLRIADAPRTAEFP